MYCCVGFGRLYFSKNWSISFRLSHLLSWRCLYISLYHLMSIPCGGFSSLILSLCLSFFFFWLYLQACEMFVSKPGIKLPPAMEVQRLYHWNWGSPFLFLILVIYVLSCFCDYPNEKYFLFYWSF